MRGATLKGAVRWFECNIAFVSWHRYWKGVYLHIFPVYCVRVYLWGIDWHRKKLRALP